MKVVHHFAHILPCCNFYKNPSCLPGFTICAVRRHADKLSPLLEQIKAKGGEAFGFGVDCRKEDKVVGLVEEIEENIGNIEVAVFNVGANVKFGITETTARVYFKGM